MPKINILDSSIFNLIAAGEVVERPLSVVKELVENSIDAGAKRISVDLKDRPARIIVSDDGCGIEPDDMRSAFLPHATSKIAAIDDLNKIGTLGFRGEALCSIAAVAKVTAVSRSAGNEIGAKIVIENGVVLEEESAGCPLGTTVTVTDLFKNLPARAKFLAKPGIEEGEITNLIARLIFANPDISIKYSAGGKTVYHSDGQGLKSAVDSVYGRQIAAKTTHFKCTMSDIVPQNSGCGIVIEGILGHPTLTKPSRNYGTVVVNGRYVKCPQIEKAVFEAYSPYLMKHQFPLFLLHINVPLDFVDVNVHPNKTEVRFADGKKLVERLGGIIADKATEMSRAVIAPPPPAAAKINFQPPERDDAPAGDILQSVIIDKPASHIFTAFESPRFFSEESPAPPPKARYAPPKAEELFEQAELPQAANAAYSVLCRLYNTYIVVQSAGTVFLIDQHAAHERLIFDKYSEEVKARQIVLQPLLLPYVFTLMPNQAANLRGSLDTLAAAGIEIEEWGDNSFRITGLAQALVDCNLEKLVAALLDGFGRRVHKLIEEQIIMAACKAAVKGEAGLSDGEIASLLAAMDAKSPALFCPHGRPIVVRWDKADIDKRFGRTGTVKK